MPDLQSSVDPHSIVRTHAAHQTILVDIVSAVLNYVGWAEPGYPVTDPVWRLARITKDGSGNVTAVEWANGNALYTKQYSARAGYAYA